MTGNLSIMGFWIFLGLATLGFTLDNGLTNIAQAITEYVKALRGES